MRQTFLTSGRLLSSLMTLLLVCEMGLASQIHPKIYARKTEAAAAIVERLVSMMRLIDCHALPEYFYLPDWAQALKSRLETHTVDDLNSILLRIEATYRFYASDLQINPKSLNARIARNPDDFLQMTSEQLWRVRKQMHVLAIPLESQAELALALFPLLQNGLNIGDEKPEPVPLQTILKKLDAANEPNVVNRLQELMAIFTPDELYEAVQSDNYDTTNSESMLGARLNKKNLPRKLTQEFLADVQRLAAKPKLSLASIRLLKRLQTEYPEAPEIQTIPAIILLADSEISPDIKKGDQTFYTCAAEIVVAVASHKRRVRLVKP